MPIHAKQIQIDPMLAVINRGLTLSAIAEELLNTSGEVLKHTPPTVTEDEAKAFVLANASIIDDDLQWLESVTSTGQTAQQSFRCRTGQVIV